MKSLFLILLFLPLFKLQAQVNIITTIANVDTDGGYNGDSILATTAELYYPEAVCFDKSGNLLIADLANQRIRKIDTFGIVNTVVGTGTAGYSGDGGLADTAKIYNPEGVACDAFGNLYIADFVNQRIRKVTYDTSSLCSTLATPVIKKQVIFTFFPNPATTSLTIQSTTQPLPRSPSPTSSTKSYTFNLPLQIAIFCK